MYTIELIVKNISMPLSVQRKLAEDAETVYQQVVGEMRSATSNLLELTCERQTEKKVCVISSEIVAVNMYEKSGAAASGKQPGFFSVASVEK